MWAQLTPTLGHLALTLVRSGRARAALQVAERAEALEGRPGGDTPNAAFLAHVLCHVRAAAGHHAAALRQLDAAERLLPENDGFRALVPVLRAEAWLALGREEEAERALDAAEHRLRASPTSALWARLWLTRALVSDPLDAAEFAGRAIERARSRGLGGLVVAGHARRSAALLRAGRVEAALADAREAEQWLDTHDPTVATRGEVLLSVALALDAARDPRAAEALERARAWWRTAVLDDLADLGVPHEPTAAPHRPLHRAVVLGFDRRSSGPS